MVPMALTMEKLQAKLAVSNIVREYMWYYWWPSGIVTAVLTDGCMEVPDIFVPWYDSRYVSSCVFMCSSIQRSDSTLCLRRMLCDMRAHSAGGVSCVTY